ncbi:MAG: hypothetical protein OQJ95_09875 [Kangiella sp.]|nr:hypothetical protein [Kangiella sp.]
MRIFLLVLFLSILSTSFSTAKPELPEKLVMAIEGLNGNRPTIEASIKTIQSHLNQTPSFHMFLTSARALAVGDFENAAFLFYAAQIRAKYDLQRFPPLSSGGSSPKLALGAVKQQIGSEINPKIFRQPELYAKVVKRIENWDSETVENYSPGWKYKNALDKTEQKKALEETRSGYLNFAKGFSKLLNNKEYYLSFKTVQDFNFGGSGKWDEPDEINKKKQAEKKMESIERKLNINGMYYKGE